MRFLLVACLFILGWYGLYSLAKELSNRSRALTTLGEIAALTKRPVGTVHGDPAQSSELVAQQAALTMPRGQAVAPKPVIASSFWVEVLYPARLHRGPSVDTPMIAIEKIGTTLRVCGEHQGWFEVNEPLTGDSGWIYGKYLGAVGGPTKVQIASENASVNQPPSIEATSVNDGAPVARLADAKQKYRSLRSKAVAEASAQTSQAKVNKRPHQNEMASLLERGFSGY